MDGSLGQAASEVQTQTHPLHKPKRNSPERAQMLSDRTRDQRSRTGTVIRAGAHRSLSTRGERGETWRTKRWTTARWGALSESTSSNMCANYALADLDSLLFRYKHRRLRDHLAAHPNDGAAQASLARLIA